MRIFSLILTAFIVIYGGMTILVGAVQFKKRMISKPSSILMILGGALMIVSLFTGANLGFKAIFILISGLLLIHISAIINGLKLYGKINRSHHLIRLIISILIIVMFLIR